MPWYLFPLSWVFYLVRSTVEHAVIFAFGCLVLALVALCAGVTYRRLLERWALFNIALVIAGAAMSGFWDCLIYGHLYVMMDYISDFSPFFPPVTQLTIDNHFDGYGGHLIGVTIGQLQLVWSLFALATWGIALAIYFRRRWIWPHITQLTMRWRQPLPGKKVHF
jgi:hypothetical protein